MKKLFSNFTSKGIYLLLGIALSLSVYSVQAQITGGTISVDGSNNLTFYDSGSGLTKTLSELGSWPTSGSDIYFTDGNVGIGTTNPTNTLSIKTPDVNGRGIEIISPADVVVSYLGTAGASGNRYGALSLNDDAGVTTVSLRGEGDSYFNAGNVGIGVTTPLYKLDVAGTANVTNLRVNNGYIYASGNGNVWFGDGAGVNADNFHFNISQGIWTSAGNFGIGTTVPSQKLDVVGSAKISGDIYMADSKSIRIDDPTDDSGLFIANYGDGNGFCYANDSLNTVSCPTRYSADLYVENGVMATKFCIGDTDCKNSWGDIADNLWTDNGTYLFANNATSVVVTNLGNVGIGTTSPGARLHVSGNYILIDNDSGYYAKDTAGTNRTLLTMNSSDETVIYNNSGGNGGPIVFGSKTGGSESMRITSSGSVGIGKTSPAGTLDVQGSICFSGDCKSSWSGAGSYWEISGNNVYRSSGNVGIGSASPRTLLDVSGQLAFTETYTGAGGYSGDRTAIVLDDTNRRGSIQLRPNGDMLIGIESNDDLLFIQNNAERMRINTSGNVGIGVTNPDQKLDVNGNMRVGTPTAGSKIILQGAIGSVDQFNISNLLSDGNFIKIAANSTPSAFMVMNNEGNVGIGTIGPSQKLDVNGNVTANVYYDRNNTAYYFDGSSTGTSIRTAGIIRADNAIQVDGNTVIDNGAGWHRSYGSTGWYNNTYGGGIYMIDSTYIRTYGSKRFYVNNYIYGTRFYDQNSTSYYVDPASTSYLNDVRADIFYDRNDPTYYANPGGTSYFYSLGIGTSSPGSWRLKVSGTSGIWGIGTNGTGVEGQSSTSSGVLGIGPGTGGVLSRKTGIHGIQGSTSDYAGYFDGRLQVVGSTYANAFYDTSSSNYYVDPYSNSTSAYFGGKLYLNQRVSTGTAINVYGKEALWFNNDYFSWGFGGNYNYFDDDIRIGTTADYGALNVNGDIKATGILLSDGDGGIWDGSFYWRIYAYGNTFLNGGTYQGSDVRFKKNIIPIENALNKVSQLRGVSYEFKKDEFPERGFSDGTQIGLIGQELEEVFPEFVKEDMEGYKSVSYDRITAVLIEAVKELKEEKEKQQTEIEQLKQLVCKDHQKSEICN